VPEIPGICIVENGQKIFIEEAELQWRFIRASGPGGQNVNKVSTAVQLRFAAATSPSLPEPIRARLIRLAGRCATVEGVLVIDARRHRSQGRNRQDAIKRLAELIRKAAAQPAPRKKTQPTVASKQRRLESKHRRSNIKQTRKPPRDE
jgi:ribosome-associated protein